MKVAILTQPLGHNYGGLLQAYALQRFLSDQGFDVETIDRQINPRTLTVIRARAKNTARFALGRIQTIPTKRKQARMLTQLGQFKGQQLNISPRILSDRALKAYCRKEAFDAFVVGSDQVWRPRYSPNLYNFFLDFLDDSFPAVPRLSYAASFGVDQWEFSPQETAHCRDLIQRFDTVSVREQSGIALCRNYLDRDAEQMPDPTLLLDPRVYHQLINDTSPPSAFDTGVLAYLLDKRDQNAEILERASDELGLKSFSIKPRKSLAQVARRNFNECVYPGIPAWLKGFRDARFVVTDSFHGVLFSIIFNKPFVAIGNQTRGLSRFHSLLMLFGLERRLVESAAEVTSSLANASIDWARVNAIRQQQQTAGSRFLINNISQG